MSSLINSLLGISPALSACTASTVYVPVTEFITATATVTSLPPMSTSTTTVQVTSFFTVTESAIPSTSTSTTTVVVPYTSYLTVTATMTNTPADPETSVSAAAANSGPYSYIGSSGSTIWLGATPSGGQSLVQDTTTIFVTAGQSSDVADTSLPTYSVPPFTSTSFSMVPATSTSTRTLTSYLSYAPTQGDPSNITTTQLTYSPGDATAATSTMYLTLTSGVTITSTVTTAGSSPQQTGSTADPSASIGSAQSSTTSFTFLSDATGVSSAESPSIATSQVAPGSSTAGNTGVSQAASSSSVADNTGVSQAVSSSSAPDNIGASQTALSSSASESIPVVSTPSPASTPSASGPQLPSSALSSVLGSISSAPLLTSAFYPDSTIPTLSSGPATSLLPTAPSTFITAAGSPSLSTPSSAALGATSNGAISSILSTGPLASLPSVDSTLPITSAASAGSSAPSSGVSESPSSASGPSSSSSDSPSSASDSSSSASDSSAGASGSSSSAAGSSSSVAGSSVSTSGATSSVAANSTLLSSLLPSLSATNAISSLLPSLSATNAISSLLSSAVSTTPIGLNSSQASLTATSTASTASESPTNPVERFTLTFDDLPVFSPTNQTDITGRPPIGTAGLYNHLSFDGYVYAPSSAEPFSPVSSPNVAVFLANATGLTVGPPTASQGINGTKPGEINDPMPASPAFYFDAYSTYAGCDNAGPEACTLFATGYTWDAVRNTEVPSYTQNTTLAPCVGMTNCQLQPITFAPSFRRLSGLQMLAYVGNQPVLFYLDNMVLSWTNNAPVAVEMRAQMV